MRLWRLDADGALDETTVPSYVDIFPYELSGTKMRILDSGQQLDVRCPLVVRVSLPDGTTVPVEDPYYVEALRSSRRVRAARGFGGADEPSLEPTVNGGRR